MVISLLYGFIDGGRVYVYAVFLWVWDFGNREVGVSVIFRLVLRCGCYFFCFWREVNFSEFKVIRVRRMVVIS